MVTPRVWETDRQNLKLLHNSLVRSKIDYGAVVHDSAKDTELWKLNIIQHELVEPCIQVQYQVYKSKQIFHHLISEE